MKIRVGFGYDVHRLSEGESLILGGVKIIHFKGTIGHSDGDVLIHAIIDALLGAANLRDIGFHFPDTSDSYKDIDSTLLLKEVKAKLSSAGYSIGNIDSTICLQQPKISRDIPAMIKKLSKVLEIPEEDISIKATTTERLGFVGMEEGISAYATVLIQKS